MRFLLYGIHHMGDCVLQQLLRNGFRPQILVTKADSGDETKQLISRAIHEGISVWQPESPSDCDYLLKLEQLDLDLAVVAGYHKKIPERAITTPRMGTINLHGSLLPKYRGPSTWKQMIINGETIAGVTIHEMTADLDRGDILAQKMVPIMDSDTGGSLFLKLCEAGAELLPETLKRLEAGTIQPVPQDEESASYYSYLTDTERRIDWHETANRIRNQVRGLAPRPGAFMDFHGDRFGVTTVEPCTSMSGAMPGSILDCGQRGLKVATGSLDLWVKTDRDLDLDVATLNLEVLI